MVNFALRLSGPPVQKITKSESISHLKTINELFFVFIGESKGPTWVSNCKVKNFFKCYFSVFGSNFLPYLCLIKSDIIILICNHFF